MDEGDVGQADKAEQMSQVRLLEVQSLPRAFAIEATAGLNDDQSNKARRPVGMLKLYIGAPMTMVSAARSSAISSSESVRAASSARLSDCP
jgi:hypothetical protein